MAPGVPIEIYECQMSEADAWLNITSWGGVYMAQTRAHLLTSTYVTESSIVRINQQP
jgi:hypothetical protein